MSENTMQQTGQAHDDDEALALVNDVLSVTDGPGTVLEDPDEFVKSLEGKSPEERSQKGRERVKALAEAGVDVETQMTERDFLKRVVRLTKSDFDSLFKAAYKRKHSKQGQGEDDKPILNLTDERVGYLRLTELLDQGTIPETYVRDGKLVHVETVSGVRTTGKKFNVSTYQAKDVSVSVLRRLVAHHIRTQKFTDSGAESSPLPAPSLCDAVLSEPNWPGLPTLNALVDAPFVREDGTICQVLGFDVATGMWLGLPKGYVPVPEIPSTEEVTEARKLILDRVLRDFPFVTTADRANTVALLLTPMIRNIIKCPVPFCIINAHAPGSGKTLIAKIAIAAHGGDAWTFPKDNDDELRKQITTILMSQNTPIVNFDNLKRGSTVGSPALDSLLTSDVWKDRILGGNSSVALPNDKMWVATGNNLQVSTDIGTRSIMIELDAKMERPDHRPTEEFELGDLEVWLLQDENRAALVRALLVLIRDWAAAGMPKTVHTMRVFTPWAQAIGGLLDHHGITGFLENADTMVEADEEKQQMSLFLQKWLEIVGPGPISASDLNTKYEAMHRARYTMSESLGVDRWQGSFPTGKGGKPYNAIGLGKWLGARKDTPALGFVLRKDTDNEKRAVWRVERMEEKKVPKQMTAFDAEAEMA
jgi:hypothetical protein